MADSIIMDEICCVLLKGPITVSTHGQFRHDADIGGSSKEVKRALGRLITDKVVVRHRPPPTNCTDGEQPITLWLAPPTCS